MSFMRSALVLSSIYGLAAGLFGKEPITVGDLLKIAHVTEVQVTPDGGFAVYGVQTIHTERAAAGGDPTYSYRVNLWGVDLRAPHAEPIELTNGDRNDSGISISPDGRQFAFVRADEKKHPQVWVAPLTGPGEPRMVTDLETGATAPRWRSDARALLVTSAVPVNKLPGKPEFALERPGRDWWDYDRAKNGTAEDGNPDGDLRAIRDWLEYNSAHNDPSDLTRIGFLGELSLNNEITFSELYRVDLGAEPKTVKLTESFRNHDAAVYSPSGDRILFAAEPDPKEHPDRTEGKSSIWEMNADGSQEKLLLNQQGYSFFQAQFTHDGKQLIVTGMHGTPLYGQTMIGRCDPDGRHLTWLTNEQEAGVQKVELDGDGGIYYSLNYHGGQPLLSLDPANPRVKQTLVESAFGVPVFAVGGDKIVFARVSAANPNELFLQVRGERGEGRQLTSLNQDWLKQREISLPEEHWITRPDGVRVQYWMMRPTNMQPGPKYPWVLDMHGGPAAMWGPGEFTMWHEFQMFCSFGYGVVYSNPRGSNGYGYDFEHANYKDWGDGPMGDVMSALDDAIVKEPAIDRDRLFVTGGSYAGYLTAWVVGHTDRFKAAAALRGVYDLATFFGEGNAYPLVSGEFGGYPWEPETRQLLEKESPITYVANIKTPLLIIHGSADNRTGVVQGQMLFRALKELNRPVEYVRYPGAGHEITRSGAPRQRMDHMLRIIEFFERYANNQRPTPKVPGNTTTPAQNPRTGVQ
jgi:dipeptidyl aminopeptidase/acylaminoacyl peptidase